jgi:hypothetical protein
LSLHLLLRMIRLILLYSMCILSSSVVSQATQTVNEINSDLPDETEGTNILNKNEVQIECSYLRANFPSGPQPRIVQALLRYGLLEKVEVRLLVEDGSYRDRYLEETVESTYPLALSTKITLLHKHGVLPDITLVAYLKLPYTSHTTEQTNYWSPMVALTFNNDIGERWSVEYTAAVQEEPFSTEWVTSSSASLHFKLTRRWEIFSEYYGQYKSGEGAMHNAGIGSFYQFNNHFGAYLVGGKSFSSAPINSFGSIGIVVRP